MTLWAEAHQASLSFSISQSCSNSRPLSRWCHPTISSSVVPFSSCLQFFPSIRVFFNKLALHIRWPKYWNFSFSISPSREYSGLISFRMDWLDLLAVQGILKSLLQDHNSKASTLQHSAFLMVQLTSVHDYWTLMLKRNWDNCCFRGCTQVLYFGLFCWIWGLLHFFQDILAHSHRHMFIWIKFAHPCQF